MKRKKLPDGMSEYFSEMRRKGGKIGGKIGGRRRLP
jgi:hypothetical protein